MKKVELPAFEVDDPMGWLGKMERYFDVHDTPEECKLKLTYICMHSSTVHWCRWMKARVPNMKSDRFPAEVLIKRYGGFDENPFEMMASLQQGLLLMNAYIDNFNMLVAQVGDVQEDQISWVLHEWFEDGGTVADDNP